MNNKNKGRLETVRLWITAVGLLISAGALLCAAYGINQQHEWQRRHFAAEMINAWNSQSSTHKAAIENVYPYLFRDERAKESRQPIPLEEARQIYLSTKDADATRWETRNHCIALLNYFEFVASAWEKQVGDRKMLEDSFKSTILRWHHDLGEFMAVMRDYRSYHPWPPLTRVVAQWTADNTKIQGAQPTG